MYQDVNYKGTFIGIWVGPTPKNEWRIHCLTRRDSTGSKEVLTKLPLPDELSAKVFATKEQARTAALNYGKSVVDLEL